MTEVTRVPLQPIAKGSLVKLWLGVVIAAVIGFGIAWAAVPKSVSVDTLTEGSGPMVKVGDWVFVKYTGKLPDGTVFEESRDPPIPPGFLPKGSPFPVEEGATIPGFFEGLQKMQKGGKYVLEIPPEKAYGDQLPPGSPIPPNSGLVFDIEVIDVLAGSDFEMRVQAMQQIMQQQQGGAEGAGGPDGPGGPTGPQPTGPQPTGPDAPKAQ